MIFSRNLNGAFFSWVSNLFAHLYSGKSDHLLHFEAESYKVPLHTKQKVIHSLMHNAANNPMIDDGEKLSVAFCSRVSSVQFGRGELSQKALGPSQDNSFYLPAAS